MSEIILHGITIEDLLVKIGKIIDDKITKKDSLISNEAQYLSRREVAKLLKISLPTLHDWTKLGWLQSYKIGKRVLYKPHEVEQALTKTLNSKYNRGMS